MNLTVLQWELCKCTEVTQVITDHRINEQFFNPVFDFQPAENRNSELLKLTVLEENDQFWKCMREFRSSADFEKDSSFYYSDSVISGKKLMTEQIINGRRFFEKPYAVWNAEKRVIFKTNDSLQSSVHREGMIPVNSYDLNAQVFVDLVQTCDSTELITKTIFDPFSSYYNLIVSKETNVFINIYFDLMEIQRRKYAKRIAHIVESKGSQQEISALIEVMKIENSTIKKTYFKAVQRGTILDELSKWNEVVKSELGIDNFAIFGISKE